MAVAAQVLPAPSVTDNDYNTSRVKMAAACMQAQPALVLKTVHTRSNVSSE